MKIEIFEEKNSSSLEVIKPDIDEYLVRICEDIQILKQEFPKLYFRQYQLDNNLIEFKENKEVEKLLKSNGNKVLPITTIEDKIIKSGNYPTIEELRKYLKNS
ncbi:MAG: arsenic metallochaperone ArsD family protein [Romboutsia sp.]